MRSGTITLYIDTSSSYLYTGIVKDDELLIEVKEYFQKDLSTYALARIEEMFQKANLKPIDVDKIIVVNGPGSFTGIRIGITIAKTFAWALHKKITTITSLEAMSVSTSTNTYKIPMIDARRGYVFAGIYSKDNDIILKNQYIKLDELQELASKLKSPYQMITNDLIEVEKVNYMPDILKIVTMYRDKKEINPHVVNPEYLKRTEAEETKGIKVE